MCQASHDSLRLDRLEIIHVSREGCCSGDLTASGPPPTYLYMVLCNYSIGVCIKVEARPGVRIEYGAVGTLARRRGLCEGRWRKSEPCWRAWTRRRLLWCGTANPNLELGPAGSRTCQSATGTLNAIRRPQTTRLERWTCHLIRLSALEESTTPLFPSGSQGLGPEDIFGPGIIGSKALLYRSDCI